MVFALQFADDHAMDLLRDALPARSQSHANFGSSRLVIIKDFLRLRFSPHYSCAVKSAGQPWVKVPPGIWFAPPGSNRSGGRDNEAVGAFGVEGRFSDLASMKAVT